RIADALFKTDGDWQVRLGEGQPAGMLVRVENGIGDVHKVTYWNLNQPVEDGEHVYAGHDPFDSSETEYPYYYISDAMEDRIEDGRARYFAASIPVVSAIEAHTGVASGPVAERVITTYRYGGAVLDATGRGFQ